MKNSYSMIFYAALLLTAKPAFSMIHDLEDKRHMFYDHHVRDKCLAIKNIDAGNFPDFLEKFQRAINKVTDEERLSRHFQVDAQEFKVPTQVLYLDYAMGQAITPAFFDGIERLAHQMPDLQTLVVGLSETQARWSFAAPIDAMIASLKTSNPNLNIIFNR